MWAWLSNSKNQKTLAWIGMALVAIASAGWTAYEKLWGGPQPPLPTTVVVPAAPQPPVASVQGNTNIGGQQVNVGNIGGEATVIITQQGNNEP